MTLYVPDHFRIDDGERLLEFVERHGFATLASAGTAGIQVSHVPLVAERDASGRVRLLGHVAKANPHWRALGEAAQVLAIFHGPHGYVSPSWYGSHPAVPTWNYAVVHAHGTARLLDEAELHELLITLSSKYESARQSPWKMSALPAPYVSGMLAAIVGFEIEVERLEGKFKLSQNRPGEIGRVIDALDAEEPALAALMREHHARPKG
jgi:transcriptional regulator